jgi:MHS family citrate/tricarballylate:H+ symporter-like MFS transporter
MAVLTAEQRKKKIGDVFRVASGNFLEQYDFFVYAYYARQIGAAFFPSNDPFAELMASFATFGVGFLMRPLGAVVLGAYIDRHGRRKGLILTLAMMAVGTLTIAMTPSYAQIGVAAPIIVVIGRLLQGFSAGVELGGVSVYLAEIATPGRRGFYTSWQSASQQIAVVMAALIGAIVTSQLTAAQMGVWGWRVPLLIGCAIIPVIFWLRRSLTETEEFHKLKTADSAGHVFRIMAQNWGLILIGMGMVIFTTTAFYLITAYTPTFGREALKLDATGVLMVTIAVGLSNFIWLPIGGAISDRIGRYPQLILMPALALLTAYPLMRWLVADPSFGKLLVTVLVFSFYYGIYNGGMIPLLAEVMPAQVRTAGFSLAYALATALFGGFTPLVSTALIEQTGDRAAPAWWLCVAAVLSLAGVLASRRRVVQTTMAD